MLMLTNLCTVVSAVVYTLIFGQFSKTSVAAHQECLRADNERQWTRIVNVLNVHSKTRSILILRVMKLSCVPQLALWRRLHHQRSATRPCRTAQLRSEEHTSELQSLTRISSADI